VYVELLRLFFEVTQSPVLFVGLIVFVMASWALIVSALVEIAIRLFDLPESRESARPGPHQR
jgi:hypothetical protein